ncbi:MAG: hypothetical protein J6V50_04600 [Clostridia bacterium]|nr:hypothetical protein [Clostridia bacterium]
MYQCKNCKEEFSLPVVDYHIHRDINKAVSYCPHCMSENISKIEVCYCAFCGENVVPKEQKYCDDTCKKLGEMLEKRRAEREKTVQQFNVQSAIKEVDDYNKAHGTNYTYGLYFALKGIGGLDDN